MIVTVAVTQDDIDKGCAGKARACPVWLALCRAFPHLPKDGIAVGCRHCCLTNDDDWLGLPLVAEQFIDRLDKGLPVAPFTFGLDVPDHLLAAVAGG